MKWRDSTLGKLTAEDDGLIQTGPFGSQLHQADYQAEGIPVIMPKDIADGRVLVESVARVSEETANRLERHKLKPRSIVLPRRGEVTKRAFIRAEQEGWLCGTGCLKIELSGKELVPEFLYYFMEQGHVVQWLEQHAVGTTMLNLSAGIVADLPIHYPAIEVQHEIAEVLSTYDSLIENNLRRMKLLEESARLLYSEWFVHLRFPGHEHTRIVHGVPEGWEKQHLSDVSEINCETINSAYQGQIEYVDISSVTPGCINETTLYEFTEAPGRARRVVQHGDIIWSCVRPNRRSHAVIWQPPANLIVSTGFAVISPTALPTTFLYFATTTDDFVGHLTNNARGAAYPAVVARDFEESELLIPPGSLVEAFNSYTESILTQGQNLRIQNQKLKAARDLLLPKLMSGEIAV